MIERELDNCFYTGSLNHKATLVYQDNLSLVSTIIKTFTHYKQILHFWTIETQDLLLTQKSQLQPCKKHTYQPRITPGTQ